MRLGNARVKLKSDLARITDKTAKALKLRFAAVCFRAVYEVDRYFLAGLFVLFLKAQNLKLLAAHTFVIGHRFGRPAHIKPREKTKHKQDKYQSRHARSFANLF